MTNPEQVQATFENYNGPVYFQDPLSFGDDPFFPTDVGMADDESESVLWVPMTKTPTESPDGRKMVPARIPENVTAGVFRQVLSGAFQTYLERGRLPYEAVARVAGVSVPVARSVMATEEFGIALALRGVDTEGVGTITPQQDDALMILTDIGSKMNWGQRLKAAGISQTTFSAWMKNPTFSRRFGQIAEDITSNHNLALIQLGQKVGEGDFNAIRFQLAVSGRFSESSQAAADIMLMMNSVLESLVKHLGANHPEVLKAVAADMRMLAETVAQQKVQVIEG